MGRKQIGRLTRRSRLVLLLVGLFSCTIVYVILFSGEKGGNLEKNSECCKGIEHLELWGNAAKWGADFKVESSEECCRACKEMCDGEKGQCLCDSWVYCGDREACGTRFGECWLKKQKDTLDPDRRDFGDRVIWTSGMIFGKGEVVINMSEPRQTYPTTLYCIHLHKGIVGLETNYGIIHIKLLPDCAPHSVSYILELLAARHCPGCHFFRAESRGNSWDSEGNHIENAAFGPPYALIQGTLEAHGTMFNKIPKEDSPRITRGSVAWVGSGPEFFISLAHHDEWMKAYTVFGSVLPEYMEVADKIGRLPTKPDMWSNINVSVLEKAVPLRFQRLSS